MLTFSFLKKKGFTLVEMLIVVAIIGIIAAMAGGNLQASKRRARLEEQAQEFIGALEEARSSSVGAKEGKRHGIEYYNTVVGTVHMAAYKLFSRDDDDIDTMLSNTLFDDGTGFTPAPGKVVFEKLTGVPESTATITMESEYYKIEIKVLHESIKKEKIEKID